MNIQDINRAIHRGIINEEVTSAILQQKIPLSAARKLKAASIILKTDKSTARLILERIEVEMLCEDITMGRVSPDLISLAAKIWKSSSELRQCIYESPLAPTAALSILLPTLREKQLEDLAKDELRLILAPSLIEALLDDNRLDEDVKDQLRALRDRIAEDEELQIREEFDAENLSEEAHEAFIEEDDEDEEKQIDENSNIYALLKSMTIAEKARLAQKANKSVRLLLVKDSNRLVARSVMRSPRLTENDVEQIARTREVDEDVLRIISQSKLWMRKYSIMKNLAFNPRTPLAISMTLTKNLSNNDIKAGSRDHNIPAALRQFISKVAQKRGLR